MNYVTTQMPTSTLDAVKANCTGFSTSLTPYKVNLTEDEKKGRSMAEGREGYARLVSQVANNNLNSLARDQNPAELSTKLAYDAKLEESRHALMTLLEIISETQLANSIDIMSMVDSYVKVLQISRTGNGSLDLEMREVDDWNKRFANKEDKTKTEGEDSAS